MADFNNKISLTLQTDAPQVTQAGFGTVMVVGEPEVGFTERVRTYASPSDIEADSADLSAQMKRQLLQAFSGSNKPSQVKAGRKEAAEDYDVALAAIQDEDGDFYGLVIESRAKADQADTATYALANKKFFMAQSSDPLIGDAGDATDIASVLQAASNDRAGVLYKEDDDAPGDAAWLADRLAINPDTQSATFAHVILRGVSVDKVNTTFKNAGLAKNANFHLPFYGLNVVNPGRLADGTPMDQRITLDWLLARCNEGIAQALVNASVAGKIPYTDQGFKKVEAPIQSVLATGMGADHFVDGTAFVSMPRRRDIPSGDVQSRKLTFTFGVALAGAVEEVEVTGTVTFDVAALALLADQ